MPFLKLNKASETGDDLGCILVVSTNSIAFVEADIKATAVVFVNGDQRWVKEGVEAVYELCSAK